MALNATGAISLAGTTAGQSIELELGGDGTTTISLNDTTVRGLAGIASGAVALGNFYGKISSTVVNIPINVDTTNYTLNPAAVTGYLAGKTIVNLTIGTNIYLYATSTVNAALTISGFTAGDTINIINNGYIMGMGGDGASFNANGGVGGPAISLGFKVNITNNRYIAGGGGGGGGFQATSTSIFGYSGGGGAGGGSGGTGSFSAGTTGGAGGSPGVAGADAAYSLNTVQSICVAGGGGGRILPGVGGASATTATAIYSGLTLWINGKGGGAGGSGCAAATGPNTATSGAGGAAGGAGGNGATTGLGNATGGGGGWGSAGGSCTFNAPTTVTNIIIRTPGTGGNAIALNGFTVTYTTQGTIYGAVA